MVNNFFSSFGNKANKSNERLFSHIHHVDTSFLVEFHSSSQPVFILNTGRSGSAFLNNLFANFSNLSSFHEAQPNLMMFPNYAFHNQEKSEVLIEVFRAARMELMLESFVENKTYIETNQCLVFFSNQIIDLFPNAKFIHLVRHPGDFVRSAIMKGWHKNDSIWENGRIRMEDENNWKRLTQIEKLSWVWSSTHEFIEKIKKRNSKKFQTFRLEDITQIEVELMELLKIIGVHDVPRDLKRKMEMKTNKIFISRNEPSNMFKLKHFPEYSDWTLSEKKQLEKFVMPLARHYDYTI